MRSYDTPQVISYLQDYTKQFAIKGQAKNFELAFFAYFYMFEL